MKKLEEINELELEFSPFRRICEFSATSFTDTRSYVLSDGVMMSKVGLVDRQQSSKVYRGGDNSKIVMMLKPASLQLFTWLVLNMPSGRDWIQVNEDYFRLLSGIKSVTTYNSAVKELARYQIIILSHYRSVFWVNPEFIFNGDRLKKYPENVRVVSEVVR